MRAKLSFAFSTVLLVGGCTSSEPASSPRSPTPNLNLVASVEALNSAVGGCAKRIGPAGLGAWAYVTRTGVWRATVTGSRGREYVSVHLSRDGHSLDKNIMVRLSERAVSWTDSDSLRAAGVTSSFQPIAEARAEARTPRGQAVLQLVDRARATCEPTT